MKHVMDDKLPDDHEIEAQELASEAVLENDNVDAPAFDWGQIRGEGSTPEELAARLWGPPPGEKQHGMDLKMQQRDSRGLHP